MALPFEFTLTQLSAVIGDNPYLEYWHHAITTICPEYEIDTPLRLAAFLAQCAHESNRFRAIRENLNYSAKGLLKTFPKYFRTMDQANQYANRPEKIANRVYSNRMGNRDEASGDGFRYMGRGLIQLTGKENYSWFAVSLDITVDECVEYMGTFEGAVQSACFFWELNNLNALADKQDTLGITKRINGGTLGLQERIHYFEIAKKALGA